MILKESQCDNCAIAKICKYKEKCEIINKQIVNIFEKMHSENNIFDYTFRCIYFKKDIGNIR